MSRVLAVCLLLLASSVHASPQLRFLGNFSVPLPGFLNLLPWTDAQGNVTSTLFISSFTGLPFVGGAVYSVPDISSKLDSIGSIKADTLVTALQWPNDIQAIPQSELPAGVYGILIADGFLVPGKDTGGIYAQLTTDSPQDKPTMISVTKNSYFYHTTRLVDLNSDGRLDVITARGTKPLFGTGSGELLWLQNPGGDAYHSASWTEHVLVSGPDFLFEVAELDGNTSTVEVLSTEFFNAVLSLTFINRANGAFISRRVIDPALGPGYSVRVTTLGAHGVTTLLATNHEPDADKAAMLGYEVPTDVYAGTFTKHVIASGFVTTLPGPGQASPGFPYAVYPSSSLDPKVDRPTILLAGDGTQLGYIFTPQGDQPFDYSQSVIANFSATVGAMAIADLNGDGFQEVLIPAYDAYQVYVYTFAP